MWFSVFAGANALGRSSSTNALILVGSWVVLVLVSPIALNLLASWLNPTPLRTAPTTRTRLMTIGDLNKDNDLLSTHYRYTNRPELLLPHNGKIDMPARLRALYLIDKEVDDRIQGVLDQFDLQNRRATKALFATTGSFLPPRCCMNP
ncbi:MAG: hypothetical protein H7Y20_14425 [Bryobacteraceae bacterium]|nr:hypothetical protein [Bryobacteraceae bacterium]